LFQILQHLLARVARRFTEWTNTTTLTIAELLALPLVGEKATAKVEKVQESKRQQQPCGSIRIQRQVFEFFADHGVKTILNPAGNNGCPYEEGKDYPKGEDCPF
jgi:hypothetical protein